MICKKVNFNSLDILSIYALRQKELRAPLELNLFDEDLLSEREELFFAVFKNKEVLCCMQFRKIDEQTLKLRQMATKESFKGMGLGKKLVEYGEAWAQENGFKTIELHARKVAQGFYEKLRYKKVGKEFLEVDIPHYKMQKNLN